MRWKNAERGQHRWLVLQVTQPRCPCQALGTAEGSFPIPAAMDLWDFPGDVIWGHPQNPLLFTASASLQFKSWGWNRLISKPFPSHHTSIALQQKLTVRPHTHRSLSLIHRLSLSPSPPRSDAFAAAELAGLGTGSPTSLREQARA